MAAQSKPTPLAQNLRVARHRRGLTQRHVGSHLGVTPTAVSYWESGRCEPSVYDFFKLAEVLDAEPAELLR